MAFWEILPLALLCTLNYVSCMVKWEISNIFLFGSLAIKAMAFWEILPLALLCALNYVSCMVKWEISNIFLFGSLAIKAMAFWEILPLALLIKLCLMYGQMGNFQYLSVWLIGY